MHSGKCDYEIIPCPNEGCESLEQRRKMIEHLNDCPHRIITCEICGVELAACALSAHLDSDHKEMASDDSIAIFQNQVVV